MSYHLRVSSIRNTALDAGWRQDRDGSAGFKQHIWCISDTIERCGIASCEADEGAMTVKEARWLDAQDHRALVLWATDCAEHVLPVFEERYPQDQRSPPPAPPPRNGNGKTDTCRSTFGQ